MTTDKMELLRQRYRGYALEEADQLESALAERDLAGIERIAHSLAGMAGLFGYSRVGAAAGAIDRAFARGDPDAHRSCQGLIAMIRDDLGPHS